MTLYNETVLELKQNGKTPKNVLWVGSVVTGFFSWEHFASISQVQYFNGYGAQEVCKDLLVVGSNWWLERAEYDGSEWWEYKTVPIKNSQKIAPRSVVGGMWEDMSYFCDNTTT